MKYYVSYPFGVTKILKKKINRDYNFTETSIENADFIYIRLDSKTYEKNIPLGGIDIYKKALYVNNFKDFNGYLCITGDHCLGNKYLFPKIAFNILGNKKYIPKSYPFKNTFNHLILFKKLNYKHQKYILKPENDYSRSGITVIHNYYDIELWIQKYPQYKKWVLQHYVINPLLIENKKFHFRIYILMIKRPSIPNLEIYLFKYYFALCAPIDYDSKSKNLQGHLTGAKYCKVHLISDELLLQNNINFSKIKPQFFEIAKDCGSIAQQYLQPLYKHQTNYHLFACDIICDTNYQCHLLEINNGGIGTEMDDMLPLMCPQGGSLHDTKIITQLFEDMVDVVLQKKGINNGFNNIINSKQKKIIEDFQTKNNQMTPIYILVIVALLFLIIIALNRQVFKMRQNH